MVTHRKKVIVHLGDAKTGTTSLQAILHGNEKVLTARGLVYARAGREVPNAIGHHSLPRSFWACPEGSDLLELPAWAELRQEIDAADETQTIVISSEGFSSMKSAAQAQMMAKFFEGDDVRFLLSVRSPFKWVESMYSQNIKATPYITADLGQFSQNWTLMGHRAAVLLAKLFPVEAFSILRYSDDIVARLLRELGMPGLAQKQQKAQRENVRDAHAVLQAYLSLNTLKMPVHARRSLYEKMASHVQTYGEPDSRSGKTAPPEFTLTAEQRRAFLNRHLPLLEEFCDIFSFSWDDIFEG